jgi:hypothetical protein
MAVQTLPLMFVNTSVPTLEEAADPPSLPTPKPVEKFVTELTVAPVMPVPIELYPLVVKEPAPS